MHTTGRCGLFKNPAKMKMFLKMRFIDLSMNIKGRKSNAWQTILWIAFFTVLGLILFWAMNKAGVFSNQTFTAIKEKFNPFG